METEVARWLAEYKCERAEQEQAGEHKNKAKLHQNKPGETIPPGVLTPLLKHHQDLDDELKSRLQELEKRLYVSLTILFGYSGGSSDMLLLFSL